VRRVSNSGTESAGGIGGIALRAIAECWLRMVA
jgi:hypothetical protein